MLFHALIGLTFWGFLSCSASTEDSQCASFLLKNITDEIQSTIVVSLLNNAKSLLEDVKKYATIKTRCPVVETVCDRPVDCTEVKEKNTFAHSGVYKIWPWNRVVNGPIEVYCDMQDDGGAWTVPGWDRENIDNSYSFMRNTKKAPFIYAIYKNFLSSKSQVLQRRGDFGSETDYFYKDWQSYKNGFGDPAKDFWIGNDNIFALTNQRSNIMKIVLSDWEGNQTYATYEEFWIDDELRKYTMHVSGYRGTAGDSFSFTNGHSFSTKDQDNDIYEKNCAVEFKGAWWYTKCHDSNLNGLYLKGAHESYADGVEWQSLRGYYYSMKDTVIKIRPKHFQKKIDDVTPL